MSIRDRVEDGFAALAGHASAAAGSFWAFGAALAIVLTWAGLGPVFGFSETWQLFINTCTTIVTFLMVFVIQHGQNKEMRAVQLKLDELIAATEGASNRLIDVEDLSDHEIQHLYERYQRLGQEAALRVGRPGAKMTVDDAPSGEKKPVAGGAE